jgi:hypothetical protein
LHELADCTANAPHTNAQKNDLADVPCVKPELGRSMRARQGLVPWPLHHSRFFLYLSFLFLFLASLFI